MAGPGESRQDAGSREPVSVIVPWGGDEDADALIARLGRLELGAGDEVLVADNRVGGEPLEPPPGSRVRVVAAPDQRSSYHARNTAAALASGTWLLFLDADCEPEAGLIAAYLAEEPPARCGVVAGSVRPAPGQRGLLAGYARSRGHLDERFHVEQRDGGPHPAGIGPNLMIRREAFESVGGFHEGIRSGGDVEICWRLQDCGWGFAYRGAAVVHHFHVDRLGALWRQASRHAAGRLWMSRRYPGVFPRPRPVRSITRSLAAAALRALTLRGREAAYKLIEALWHAADAYGWYLGSNRAAPPPRGTPGERSVRVFVDAYPARSETFVNNQVLLLRELGWAVSVESAARPQRTERSVATQLPASYMEDDPPREKLAALVTLVLTRPLRCLADNRRCKRLADPGEAWPLAALAPAARRASGSGAVHLHAHFAAGAALHAQRISALSGIPWSLTAHAYDIYQRPRNLEAKLAAASFAAAECEHTCAELRSKLPATEGGKVHVVRTGVDAGVFRRGAPAPAGGRVLAIGRLIEKKGFEHLVRAIALLGDDAGFGALRIAGEGPLRDRLDALISDLALTDRVELVPNVWGPDGVRRELEAADLLVVPSVIAPDGDRDALPLVAYEALAMGVPVIAGDLAGLPEVIRPEWGRLVAPGDEAAIAGAIAEMLALPAGERARMGAAGREFVLEHADPRAWAARMGELIAANTTTTTHPWAV